MKLLSVVIIGVMVMMKMMVTNMMVMVMVMNMAVAMMDVKYDRDGNEYTVVVMAMIKMIIKIITRSSDVHNGFAWY